MELQPNPASGITRMSYHGSYMGDASLEIKTQFGKSIYTELINIENGHFVTNIDLNQFKSGVYYIVLKTGQQQLMKPLIVLQ